jgi:hypothetical protein
MQAWYICFRRSNIQESEPRDLENLISNMWIYRCMPKILVLLANIITGRLILSPDVGTRNFPAAGYQ